MLQLETRRYSALVVARIISLLKKRSDITRGKVRSVGDGQKTLEMSTEKISEELSEILKCGSPIIRIVDSVAVPDTSGNIRSPMILQETDEPVLSIDDKTTEFDLINMVLTFFGMENRNEIRNSKDRS